MEQATSSEFLADLIRRARYEPDWFCAEILRSPNHPWQTEFLNALADLDRREAGLKTEINHRVLRRMSLRAGHGKGKTHVLAKGLLWWNTTRRGRVVVTAPKEQQMTTRLWPELHKITAKALDGFRACLDIQGTRVMWCRDPTWFAVAETAARPENLSGHHDQELLVIVDEANGVMEPMFQVIESAITDPRNRLILSGNPTRTSGEFYASHMKAKTADLYWKRHIKADEPPLDMAKWGQEMIQKYGANSPVVKVRVLGEFVDMAEGQLISLEWLETARLRDIGGDGSIPQLRVSVDVADGGEDETVIMVARVYETRTEWLALHRFSFPPSLAPIEAGKAAKRIFEEWAGTGNDLLIPDALGVGAGTAGWLMDQRMPVLAYRGGEGSDDPVQWRNRRTQSYLVMRNHLRDGQVAIGPVFATSDTDWDDFCAQMASIISKPGTERLEDLETKQDLKRRGVKSPDMADAAAMIHAGHAPSLGRSTHEGIFTVPGIGSRMEDF